jgi:hypothetical protein
MIRRMALLAACLLPLGLLLGCQQQEQGIIHYKAPHAVDVDDDAGAAANVRLLAAMVPHADRTWFFKLEGPVKVVDAHRKEFDGFMASVHFTDGGTDPMTWKLPAGWEKQDTAAGPRYATIQVGPKDKKTQLIVSSFRGEVGGLLMNVNRWRKQIGLHPTIQSRLPKYVKDITVDGGPARLVDMTGPGGAAPSSSMPPFLQGHPPMEGHPPIGGDMRPPAAAGLHYQKPEGWKELENPGPIALKKFRTGTGEEAAEVSVTPLGGDAGGVLANVNRWRGQIGLPSVTQEQADRDLHQITVEGKAAPYADLSGPEQRMLAVIVSRGDTTWFVKTTGPKNVVAKQKSAFEAFVKSLRFGVGDSHE